MILTNNERIKINKNQNAENQFTIAKYLNNNYEFSTDKVKQYVFPIYKIPYEYEWKKYVLKGILNKLINEGTVHEIVIVEDRVENLNYDSIKHEAALDSFGTFTHSAVGKGNDYIGFRNICKWQKLNE